MKGKCSPLFQIVVSSICCLYHHAVSTVEKVTNISTIRICTPSIVRLYYFPLSKDWNVVKSKGKWNKPFHRCFEQVSV